MSVAVKIKNYPYISWKQDIADGVPIIKGTRVTVRAISGYYQMGMSVDEILNALTHLTHAQIHSALAYYFDHQEEIDNDLSISNDIDYWKNQTKVHQEIGKNTIENKTVNR